MVSTTIRETTKFQYVLTSCYNERYKVKLKLYHRLLVELTIRQDVFLNFHWLVDRSIYRLIDFHNCVLVSLVHDSHCLFCSPGTLPCRHLSILDAVHVPDGVGVALCHCGTHARCLDHHPHHCSPLHRCLQASPRSGPVHDDEHAMTAAGSCVGCICLQYSIVLWWPSREGHRARQQHSPQSGLHDPGPEPGIPPPLQDCPLLHLCVHTSCGYPQRPHLELGQGVAPLCTDAHCHGQHCVLPTLGTNPQDHWVCGWRSTRLSLCLLLHPGPARHLCRRQRCLELLTLLFLWLHVSSGIVWDAGLSAATDTKT